MRAVKIMLAGRERYLSLTVEALACIEERFGSIDALIGLLPDRGREGVAAVCGAAAILAEQGELARRALGYDPVPMADEAAIRTTLSPKEVVELSLAIPAAITLGFGREVEPEGNEVDLGLAELNAQKKTP